MKIWWTRPGSNRRPHECHSCALPTALLAHGGVACQPQLVQCLNEPAFADGFGGQPLLCKRVRRLNTQS
jgi:hypothetical protein